VRKCYSCGKDLTNKHEKYWYLVFGHKHEGRNPKFLLCEKCVYENTKKELREKIDGGLIAEML
jgi:hypothetical protein